MEQHIELATDGQPQLTPEAAAILVDIIRKTVRVTTALPNPANECPVERS